MVRLDELPRGEEQLGAQAPQRQRVPVVEQAQTLEPLHQVVGEEKKMEVRLVRKEVLGMGDVPSMTSCERVLPSRLTARTSMPPIRSTT